MKKAPAKKAPAKKPTGSTSGAAGVSSAKKTPGLTRAERKVVLEHLNEIAPDTFDEGELGPWSFEDISVVNGEFRVAASNRDGETALWFKHPGPVLGGPGRVNPSWFDAFSRCMLATEQESDD
ncbi:MAG: hypothetical protein MUF64_08635 [Polyangiaceae bacterium]|nr:hypothetical protein [Polyangiaceae bacterium]